MTINVQSKRERAYRARERYRNSGIDREAEREQQGQRERDIQ